MTIDEIAKKLWSDVFGDEEWAKDPFGRWMHRDAQSNVAVYKNIPGLDGSRDCSWNIDHIRPISSFKNEDDAESFNNYEPMHRLSNLEKSDDYHYFHVLGKRYKVVAFEGWRCYGIVDLDTASRVDWKGKQNRNYSY